MFQVQLVLISVLLMAATGFGATTGTKGQIKFESRSRDLGRMSQGDVAIHKFKFKNVGYGELRILGVHVDCGCTMVNMPAEMSYQPGEHGSLEVQFDSTDFDGPVVKTMVVTTSERPQSDRILSLKATVVGTIRVTPPVVDYGQWKNGSSANAIVKLEGINGYHLKVLSLRYEMSTLSVKRIVDDQTLQQAAATTDLKDLSSRDAVTGNIDASNTTGNGTALDDTGLNKARKTQLTNTDDNTYLYSIAMRPGAQAGSFKSNVVFITNSPTMPEVVVPVRAVIEGAITVDVPYVEFGSIGAEQFETKTIELRADEPFAILSNRHELIVSGEYVAENRVSGGKVILAVESNREPARTQQVHLKIRHPLDLTGALHGRINFRTDHPDQKEIPIDLYAFFE